MRQVRTELDQLVRKRELLLSARRQFLSNTTTSRKTTGTIADWATAARQNDARFMLFAREIGTLKVRYQGRLNTKDPRQDVFRRNLDRAWGTVRAALDKPLADGSILSRLRDWSGNNSNTSPPDSSPVRRKLWTSR